MNTPVDICFRRARPEDEDTILGLMRDLYAHYDMTHPPQAQAALRHALETDDLAHVWLLETDDGTAGYLVLTFGFSLEFGGRYGFLDELYIIPEWRGMGLGTQALRFAEEEARRLGLGALFLEADRQDEAVQRFYRRQGYTSRRYELLVKRLVDDTI